jgi:ABC-type phosphate transport system substrate-binding protein
MLHAIRELMLLCFLLLSKPYSIYRSYYLAYRYRQSSNTVYQQSFNNKATEKRTMAAQNKLLFSIHLHLCLWKLLILAAAVTAANDIDNELRKYGLPGAGGSGPFEAVTDLISAFEAKFPEADMSISSVGTGAAQSALWGDVDCLEKPVEGVCPFHFDTSVEVSEHPPLLSNATIWGVGGAPLDTGARKEHEELGLRQLPALGGPILVVYSKDVTGELGLDSAQQLNMSYATIAGIFNGTISSWNHPFLQAENPQVVLPNERITVLVRSDKSGMSQTFTEYIHHTNPDTWPEEAVGKTPKWPLANITDLSESSSITTNTDHQNWKGDGQTGIGIGLLRRPFSIGFLELGYFSTLKMFVAQAYVSGLSNPTDFERATVDTLRTVMDGLSDQLDPEDLSLNMVEQDTPVGGYPISRYVYWYIKTSAQSYASCYQAWLFYTFLEWVYTDPLAAEIALGHGWVIPPQSVVAKAVDVLEQIQCTVAEGEEQYGVLAVGDVTSAVSFVPPPFREVQQDDEPDLILIVVLVTSLLIFILLACFICYYVVMDQHRRRADTIWSVKYCEIKFGTPPEVVGRAGTFGLVLLGNYRGTDVAVKHVIPSQTKNKDKIGDENVFVDGNAYAMESGDMGWLSQDAQKGSASAIALTSNTKSTTTNAPSYTKLKADFIEEMRYLSKLRHPCITMSKLMAMKKYLRFQPLQS